MRFSALLILAIACKSPDVDTDDTDSAEGTDDVGDPALPQADAYAVVPGVPLSIDAAEGVLANDRDVETFTAGERLSEQGHSVTLSEDGSFQYDTPDAFTGPDTFTYDVAGTDGQAVLTTVTLTPRAGCGDGVIQPGELCVASTVLAPAGSLPVVTSGDINGDGTVDLVMMSGVPNGTALQPILNRDHRLELTETFEVSGTYSGHTLADVNDDSFVDLVALTSERIAIFHGDGTGAFSVGPSLTTSEEVPETGLAAVPLSGGGVRLVACPFFFYSCTHWTYDNGTLGEPDTLTIAGNYRRPYAVDVDADGDLDVLFGVGDVGNSAIEALINDGSGILAVHVLADEVRAEMDIRVADLTGDDVLDSVYGTLTERWMKPGTGDATFGDAQALIPGSDLYATSFLPMDIDGDGILDMVWGSQDVNISLASTAGAFGTPTAEPETPAYPIQMVNISDASRTRIVLVLQDRLVELVRPADQTFQDTAPRPHQTVELGTTVTDVLPIDIDSDGNLDLLLSAYDDNTVLRVRSDANGTLGEPEVFITDDNSVHSLACADLNGDDVPDMAIAKSLASAVSIWLSDGSGGYTDAGDVPVGPAPARVVLADFDEDGELDLATANVAGLGGVFSPSEDTVSVRIGDGVGGFAEGAEPELSTCQAPERLVAADIDDDGHLDLVVTCLSGPLTVMLGAGDGTFTLDTARTLSVVDAREAAVEDFDGDGLMDIVTAGVSDLGFQGEINVRLGTETGWSSPDREVLRGFSYAIALGDINGDGHTDLATSSFSGTTIRLGDGNGDFTIPTVREAAARGLELTFADLDQDGRDEVIVVNSAIQVLRHRP